MKLIRAGDGHDFTGKIFRTKPRWAGPLGQLKLNNFSFSQGPTEVGPMVGLVRLVRQVCILHEQGNAAGAARLRETDLANAVRDLRLAHGPEALSESELKALFTTEERRVAEAAILAELLVPRLVEALPSASGPVVFSGSRPVPPSQPAAMRATAPAGSPAIPDLLDAMLAAERNSRRQPATVNPES